MNSIKKITHFGMSQTEALDRGGKHRKRLLQLVGNINSVKGNEKYPHLYIYSPPGLGKTFTVKNHLEESKIFNVPVFGNVSMFAFGIQLAVIAFENHFNHKVIVYVDDCDELFKTEVSCNTMKNVLDGNKTFTYEKSLASQWSHLSDLQKDAITYFSTEGKSGFSVPTDNLVFVFTSNFKLPIDDDVREARAKGKSKSVLIGHKNAIRSRCRVADFDLSDEEEWGWIADVVLNTNCLDHLRISESDRQVILDFLWYNWNHLTERSIRLVEKMSGTMIEYPENYKSVWEIDYLKN